MLPSESEIKLTKQNIMLSKELRRAKEIMKTFLEDMDESACCCGADDYPNGPIDVCHYHQALEMTDNK